MANSFEKLKELNLTCDEIERIGEALRKPEFRKLFCEYLEEVQDPKNRKLYEEEMTQLEKERGNDIFFLHPEPGYVFKTTVDGDQLAFINIASNEYIAKPTSTPSVSENETGSTWTLPYSSTQPRDDFDRNRRPCKIYDIIFHPDTIELTKHSDVFRDLVNKTAMDDVESNFDVVLDRNNISYPKLTYKGIPSASVIRKPSEHKPEHTLEEKAFYDELFAQAEASCSSKAGLSRGKTRAKRASCDDSEYTKPKYVIKQRCFSDIQEFVEHKKAKLSSTIPSQLVVEVQLPLLKSTEDIKLEVTDKNIELISETPAKYKLDLTLPYSVDEDSSKAQFIKDEKKLLITLQVKRTVPVDPCESSASEDCVEVTPSSEEKLTTSGSELKKSPKAQSSEKSEKKSSESRTEFLDENYHYDIPEFTSHIFDNILSFTLNVKNVNESSIEKMVQNEDILQMKFTSTSSTHFTSYYAFCVKVPSFKIVTQRISVETWDNNIVLQVPIISATGETERTVLAFHYGLCPENLTEKQIEETTILRRALERPKPEESTILRRALEGNPPDSTDPVPGTSSSPDSSSTATQRPSTAAIDIAGAVTDASSADELGSMSSFSPGKGKSILKRRTVRRCVSDSALDEYESSSLDNTLSTSLEVPEVEAGEETDDGKTSGSLKKTVRFNEVVNQKIYRSNSSILGRKKKNQRKARNKKRSMERRVSESENSGDERRESTNEGGESSQAEGDVFHLEVDE